MRNRLGVLLRKMGLTGPGITIGWESETPPFKIIIYAKKDLKTIARLLQTGKFHRTKQEPYCDTVEQGWEHIKTFLDNRLADYERVPKDKKRLPGIDYIEVTYKGRKTIALR